MSDFSTPRHYRIKVKGRLRPGWFGRVGAMRVFICPHEKYKIVTVLQGRVIDQAELSGILNTLYELHMSLLSVKCLDGDQSSADVKSSWHS